MIPIPKTQPIIIHYKCGVPIIIVNTDSGNSYDMCPICKVREGKDFVSIPPNSKDYDVAYEMSTIIDKKMIKKYKIVKPPYRMNIGKIEPTWNDKDELIQKYTRRIENFRYFISYKLIEKNKPIHNPKYYENTDPFKKECSKIPEIEVLNMMTDGIPIILNKLSKSNVDRGLNHRVGRIRDKEGKLYYIHQSIISSLLESKKVRPDVMGINIDNYRNSEIRLWKVV